MIPDHIPEKTPTATDAVNLNGASVNKMKGNNANKKLHLVIMKQFCFHKRQL